jgi:hypothetical protein
MTQTVQVGQLIIVSKYPHGTPWRMYFGVPGISPSLAALNNLLSFSEMGKLEEILSLMKFEKNLAQRQVRACQGSTIIWFQDSMQYSTRMIGSQTVRNLDQDFPS